MPVLGPPTLERLCINRLVEFKAYLGATPLPDFCQRCAHTRSRLGEQARKACSEVYPCAH